jgi:hypothetical protein
MLSRTPMMKERERETKRDSGEECERQTETETVRREDRVRETDIYISRETDRE